MSKSYDKKATAAMIAVKMSKDGKVFEPKLVGGKWQVVEVIASTVSTEVGAHDASNQLIANSGLEETKPIQSVAAPDSDKSNAALVTFLVTPAKITNEYVIVPAGSLGKERWFQLSRLHSATKGDDGVTIVCTRSELISRGLKELAAKAPVFNLDAAAQEAQQEGEPSGEVNEAEVIPPANEGEAEQVTA